MTFRSLPAIALVAALVAAGSAPAHARLVASTPAAAATVGKPTKIVLTFSEKIIGMVSGADLTMTSMPGMTTHKPMKMTGFTAAMSADGKTLTLMLKHPLAVGDYQVDWHVASADTHHTQGQFAFTVK